MEHPRLIEPTMKNYLYNTLQNCHHTRIKTYNTAFNLIVFLLFVFVMGGAMYYCYKQKPTPYEQYEKMKRDQEIILSKIRYYQNERVGAKQNTAAITDLPTF